MPGALNYVANGYLFRDRQTPAPANTVVLERLRSAQQTVMISERVNSTSYPVGPWHVQVEVAPENLSLEEVASRLTFRWDAAGSVSGLGSNMWGISSNHGGLVHVAFADGHVEALTQETQTGIYLWQPPP
jgi:prepilin-type processing-associated H-X9-DG protein